MTLCEKCQERFGDEREESVCSHGGDATAHSGGNAYAFHGGDAHASDGGDAHAFVGGDAYANDGGSSFAHGSGNSFSYGGGAAYASGGGDARAHGGGVELDFRGPRRPVEHEGIEDECLAGNGWLRVGCEIHTYADWIARADESHGDGIAHLTRALAERCAAEEEEKE